LYLFSAKGAISSSPRRGLGRKNSLALKARLSYTHSARRLNPMPQKPSHKWEGPRGYRSLALVRRRRGSKSVPPSRDDRGATQPKSKSDAIRRTRALRDVWPRCSLLIPQLRDGYARHSRLASHHELLWRGLLLFRRSLLVDSRFTLPLVI
jgi:hypothetical protein